VRNHVFPIFVALAAITLGVGVYAYAHRHEGRLRETERQGAALVAALEAYRREHGVYPDSLPQLVPDHLARIDPPVWGLGRWRYRAYDAPAPAGSPDTVLRYFHLAAPANEANYPVLYYDFVERKWVLNN